MPVPYGVDKAIRIVFSYIDGFFSMNFHHVVQAVSPAIGANDVRSCGEKGALALLPL
jgi:hypothetical protein